MGGCGCVDDCEREILLIVRSCWCLVWRLIVICASVSNHYDSRFNSIHLYIRYRANRDIWFWPFPSATPPDSESLEVWRVPKSTSTRKPVQLTQSTEKLMLIMVWNWMYAQRFTQKKATPRSTFIYFFHSFIHSFWIDHAFTLPNPPKHYPISSTLFGNGSTSLTTFHKLFLDIYLNNWPLIPTYLRAIVGFRIP